jgi:hypothetical protein
MTPLKTATSKLSRARKTRKPRQHFCCLRGLEGTLKPETAYPQDRRSAQRHAQHVDAQHTWPASENLMKRL